MPQPMRHGTLWLAGLALVCAGGGVRAQTAMHHTPAVSGVPHGVPYFCEGPTATAVLSGAWSDPGIWTAGHVPGAGDRVLVGSGQTVTYDVESDARVSCVDVRGRLTFRPDRSTRLTVGNLTVMDGGTIEIGTEAQPVRADVTAEVVIADQPINAAIDPDQIGTGLQGLGVIRMHGAVKTPTFVRLAEEPTAGATSLVLDAAVSGWLAGDVLVVPDTRQLREAQRGPDFQSQDETVRVAAVEGARVVLQAPLRFEHRGARTPDGRVEFLPHVGNVTRNVVLRSENPAGTRGHTIFVNRADVDIRYVEFREMGRTRMGVLDNTTYDEHGQVAHMGDNQIGRYAIHLHHDFGPATTPSNGYQFTLIGNAVDHAPKWGVTIHNSHYGLVRDNVSYDTAGAGFVTEDGNEAFNVFDHNFALRVQGSGEGAPRSGYGGAAPDPGGEGAAFWFRGPHNYIRGNVAANADAMGYGLAAGALGVVRIPRFKGADLTQAEAGVDLDTTQSAVLEFSRNEAYGAMQMGAAWGWNGTIADFRVWHPSRQGVNAAPTDTLTIERLVARGDKTVLTSDGENPVGVWFSNYVAKSVTVRDANIQGLRVGVGSPFYPKRVEAEPGRGDGRAIVDGGYFRNYIGVSVASAYSADNETATAAKHALVRGARFDALDVRPSPLHPPAAITMNYRMATGDPEPRDPILVERFNDTPGDDFAVFYSLDAPPRNAPCQQRRAAIAGWACAPGR